jgi:hypothetical protein
MYEMYNQIEMSYANVFACNFELWVLGAAE